MSIEEKYEIFEESERKYFFQTPNIVDDLHLSVYAFRLYSHLKRLAGEEGHAFQSVTTMSKACDMSRDYIIDAKKELSKEFDELNGAPLIKIHPNKSFNMPDRITIIDIWNVNVKKYSTQSKGSTTAVDPVDYSSRRGRLKEEPLLKTTKKEIDSESDDENQIKYQNQSKEIVILRKEKIRSYLKGFDEDIILEIISSLQKEIRKISCIEAYLNTSAKNLMKKRRTENGTTNKRKTGTWEDLPQTGYFANGEHIQWDIRDAIKQRDERDLS